MKLGIGITTTPRRNVTIEQVLSTQSTDVFIHSDKEYKGVAYSRNRCIKHLADKGCDYIAICDDDLLYVKDDWLLRSAEQMEATGLAYAALPDVIKGTRIDAHSDIERWSSYIGALHILSRRALEEVGYFSEAFEGYGYEDVHYKHRVRRQYGHICNPPILPYLVHSQDVLNMNPTPSIDNKEEHIRRNAPVCDREMANGIIYYPYPGN